MRRSVRLALLLALLAALPARAEILDISAARAGAAMEILFVFDAQPEGVSVSVDGTQVQGVIAGAHAADRVLRPDADGVRQISLADRPLGLSIGILAAAPIQAAEAEVFRNAVLVRLTLADGAAPRPEQAPIPAPAPEPEPEPGLDPDPIPLTPPAPAFPPAEAQTDASQARLAAMAPIVEDGDAGPPAEPAPPSDTAADASAPIPAPEAPAAQEDSPPPSPRRPPPPSPPGAASELLAAQLDRAACEAAALQIAADSWALDALYNHGACLARDGARARAEEVFGRLIAFDPGSARALVGLGVLRQDSGDRAGADAYYDRAMANAPDDGLAVLIRLLGEL